MHDNRDKSSILPDKEDNVPLLEDGDLELKDARIRKPASRWVIYAAFITLMLALGTSNALLLYHYQRAKIDPHQHNAVTLTCGKNPEEARKMGCQLDVMVYAWTPPPCLNNTHALMYFHSEKWPFWKHENRTEEIPADDILAGKYEGYFSTWPFHGTHCQYLLSRNLQVLPTGGPLNDYMRDREHNTHCFDEVRAPTDPRRTLEVGMAYSSCTVRKVEI